jgi:hypothetical protein
MAALMNSLLNHVCKLHSENSLDGRTHELVTESGLQSFIPKIAKLNFENFIVAD